MTPPPLTPPNVCMSRACCCCRGDERSQTNTAVTNTPAHIIAFTYNTTTTHPLPRSPPHSPIASPRRAQSITSPLTPPATPFLPLSPPPTASATGCSQLRHLPLAIMPNTHHAPNLGFPWPRQLHQHRRWCGSTTAAAKSRLFGWPLTLPSRPWTWHGPTQIPWTIPGPTSLP